MLKSLKLVTSLANDCTFEFVYSFITFFFNIYLGLGCTTVLSPEGAALAAAQILALTDHVIWSRLKAQQLNRWIDLKHADKEVAV